MEAQGVKGYPMLIERTGDLLRCSNCKKTDIPQMMEVDELAGSVVFTRQEWENVLSCAETNVVGVFCSDVDSLGNVRGRDCVAVVVFQAFPLIGGAIEKLIVHPSCNRTIVAAFLFDVMLTQFEADGIEKTLTFKIHETDDEFEQNETLVRSVGFEEFLIENDPLGSFKIFGKVKE